MPAACKKSEGTSLTMILIISSTDIALRKSLLGALEEFRFAQRIQIYPS